MAAAVAAVVRVRRAVTDMGEAMIQPTTSRTSNWAAGRAEAEGGTEGLQITPHRQHPVAIAGLSNLGEQTDGVHSALAPPLMTALDRANGGRSQSNRVEAMKVANCPSLTSANSSAGAVSWTR